MKKKLSILFVDDESKILKGIQRRLRKMSKEWDMHFVTGGYEAKRFLLNNEIDVIITDIRMPGTNGQELLTYVKDKYPEVIRLVLSGYGDQKILLETTKVAHQYLSKPADPEKLKEAISRSYTLRRVLTDKKLIKIASGLRNIPSLPMIYNKIMQEIQKPEPSIKKIGSIIEQDIAMSAKMLQLVNSSFFGLTTHVKSPSQAVIMLGLNVVRSLILSIKLLEEFKEKEINPRLLEYIWNHSMEVAKTSKLIANILKLEENSIDYAYIAGLLHDIGKLIFISEFPVSYNELMSISKKDKIEITEAETRLLHAPHTKIGAYVMGIWGFPLPVVEAICYHHFPSNSENHIINELTCVHLANVFVYENKNDYYWIKPHFDEDYLKEVKINIDKIRKIVKEKNLN